MDEFSLIAKYFAPLAGPGALGLKDDAAVLDIPDGHQVVATKDAIVAGIHYLPDTAPGDIARKLLRVNLSDLAAMGAQPLGVLLACAFPKDAGEDWIAAFAMGLGKDLEFFGTGVLGGDTVSTDGPPVFSLTALGSVPHGMALTRSGAQAGDLVFASGTLGDAAAGLAVLKREITGLDGSDDLIARHQRPEPQLALGQALRGVATAAIDVSDGLVADAGHIADVSDVGIEIDAHKLPLSGPVAELIAGDADMIALPLAGGDDYELLFTAPETARDALAALDTSVIEIGRVGTGEGVRVLDRDGKIVDVPSGGWRHF